MIKVYVTSVGMVKLLKKNETIIITTSTHPSNQYCNQNCIIYISIAEYPTQYQLYVFH